MATKSRTFNRAKDEVKSDVNIDSTRDDRRCGCCRRPVAELKPFGKAGDPVVGDFDGAFLIVAGMEDWPRIEEAAIIYLAFWDGSENYEDVERKLTEEF